MSAPKLTPWFPGDVKPVREGVYEVVWVPRWPVYARFTNFGESGWACGAGRDKEAAAGRPERMGGDRPLRWRGLAAAP